MRILLVPVLIFCLFPACGYHLSGTGEALPSSAKTIAVPKFQNESSYSEAEKFVSTAIREEFVRRSRLTLVDEINRADLVLEGKINEFSLKPLSQAQNQSISRYEIRIIVNAKLLDRNSNLIIFEGNDLVFSDSYDSTGVDFFSQETRLINRISQRFAKYVVSSILENY